MICEQHNEALQGVNQRMVAALAISQANLPAHAIHTAVVIDAGMTDIEDDDYAPY